MKKFNRFSLEARKCAVNMVMSRRHEYSSMSATIASIAPLVGCVPQTLREWLRQHEVDSGLRSGVTTQERERISALMRESREQRRASELLKLLAAQAQPKQRIAHVKSNAIQSKLFT